MKAVILAAGRGSRMGQSTGNAPKCLARLWNKPLLHYQLRAIKGAGIKDIAIVRGYEKEKINMEGVTYFDNLIWDRTNMLMSLMCASGFIEDDRSIVSYSDIVYEKSAIERLADGNHAINILYSTNWLKLWRERFKDPLSDAETFKIDQYGRVTEIGKQARAVDEIQGQYMGLIGLSPEGFGIIRDYLDTLSFEEKSKMDMTTLFSHLIANKIEVFGIPYDGLWLEIDSENDLRLFDNKYIHFKG